MIDPLLRAVLAQAAARDPGRARSGALLEAAWPMLVGTELARRTRPAGWERATLTIEVASYAWVQELSFHREQVRARIARLFPWPIEALEFRVPARFEPLGERAIDDELIELPRPRRRPAPAREVGQIEEAREVARGFDEETRERVERLRRLARRRDEAG